MPSQSADRTRQFLIIAQDPAVRDSNNRILTATVAVPLEKLLAGPCGHRVQVIDFDCAANVYYPAGELPDDKPATAPDGKIDVDALIADPGFHAQNVYAIVMRVLARFEQALGRRISWAGDSHQLKLVPHAFADANAFYSRSEEAILFGYFPKNQGNGMVYTCLSHDVIVHETTHALLDGLCDRLIYPSSPDQAAFHEAFADVVALLSVFSLKGIVRTALVQRLPKGSEAANWIPVDKVSPEALRNLALLGLAEQMGQELQMTRSRALRRSVDLKPSPKYYQSSYFLPPHRRGEILVAAVMNAFIEVWSRRARQLSPVEGGKLDLDRVVEEGMDAANYLLTMVIRALDYMPPLHIQFCDYLSALITADLEIRPDDSRFQFREYLRKSFEAYGINPAVGTPVTSPGPKENPETPGNGAKTAPPAEAGAWAPADSLGLSYDYTHFESMMRDRDEVFRFIWENRQALELEGGLCDEAFSQVLSVRPCLRIAPDGFALRETIAVFYQVIRLRADELHVHGIAKPDDMPGDMTVPLYGGGTLVFDEYGRLKYYIHNGLGSAERQAARIADAWRSGVLQDRDAYATDFSQAHRMRALDSEREPHEEW